MRNLFSFICDMTHSDRLAMKITTGGKPNKSSRQSWRTQYYACNDRLNLMSNYSTADNKMRTGFNRLLLLFMALCTPRLSRFKCKNKSYTFVCFFARSIPNIQPIPVCYISDEKNVDQYIIFEQGLCLLSYFSLHTVAMQAI